MTFQSEKFPRSCLQGFGPLRDLPVMRMYLLLKQLVISGHPHCIKRLLPMHADVLLVLISHTVRVQKPKVQR